MSFRQSLAASAVALSLAALASCSSTGAGAGSTGTSSQVIPACSVPAAAETYSEASASGCQSQTVFQFCQVPSGSIVEADGAIETPDGGPADCRDACAATEFALHCSGSASADSSLGCRVLPSPTPYGVTLYCCPCGQ